VTVGRKTLEDGAADVRQRTDTEDRRLGLPELVKWVQER
jgi:hypothetical protein